MQMQLAFKSVFFGIALSSVVLPGAVYAASFNCARASGCVETVICETPQLSRQDSRMARLYEELQTMANRRGARTLLDSQREWLDNNYTCGCNANCLVTQYESRIRLFEEVLGSQ